METQLSWTGLETLSSSALDEVLNSLRPGTWLQVLLLSDSGKILVETKFEMGPEMDDDFFADSYLLHLLYAVIEIASNLENEMKTSSVLFVPLSRSDNTLRILL